MALDKKERERIRLAAVAAADAPCINLSGLARMVGWSHPSLNKFRDKGTGSAERVEHLGRILARMGILEDPMPEDHDPEAEDHIAFTECQHCGSETPRYARGRTLLWCGHCGEPLGIECFKCEHLNPNEARFCLMCGHPTTNQAQQEADELPHAAESHTHYNNNRPRKRMEF